MFESTTQVRMRGLVEKFAGPDEMTNEEILELLEESMNDLRKQLRRNGGLEAHEVVAMRLYDALKETEDWIQEEGRSSPASAISPGIFEGELPGEFSSITYILTMLGNMITHHCRCPHCNRNRTHASAALNWFVTKMGNKMPDLPPNLIEDLREAVEAREED